MPVLPSTPPPAHAARFVDPSTTPSQYAAAMRAQWQNPHDILSVLTLVGGDIVQVAATQLAGTGPAPFAPVAFSFGWLAYSISALLSALGEGRLLPPPEYASKLINVQTEYERDNQSWMLCRLLRDEEYRLKESVTKESAKGKESAKDKESAKGLIVAFYEPAKVGEMGTPARDWVYWMGVGVIVAQNVIATIPFFYHGNWVVLLVTFIGTVLALAETALPQWRREKYQARSIGPKPTDSKPLGPEPTSPKKKAVYCLMRGNGAPVVMVIVLDRGLNLEDLAGAKHEHCAETLVASVILCACWILLLLTVEGLTDDAWYLLGIGGLGMLQNILAAGVRRSPGALGFPLMRRGKPLHKEKVMDVLKAAENVKTGVGLALVPTFFPGKLRPDEEDYWMDKREKMEAEKEAEKTREKETADSVTQRSQTPASDTTCASDSSKVELSSAAESNPATIMESPKPAATPASTSRAAE